MTKGTPHRTLRARGTQQEHTDRGPDALTELWTDTTGYPHETGKTLRIADQKDNIHVSLWAGINKHYKQPFAGITRARHTLEKRAATQRARFSMLLTGC